MIFPGISDVWAELLNNISEIWASPCEDECWWHNINNRKPEEDYNQEIDSVTFQRESVKKERMVVIY